MKRQTPLVLQLACTCTLLIVLNSCLKDNCRRTYTLMTPVYKTLTEARKNMKSSSPEALINTGKIYIYGNYIFLNELNRGIHVIDNSQPAAPKNIGFINVPGNVDLAASGNFLYADSYGDLVTFDISNPKQVVAKKFLDHIFPGGSIYYVGTSSNNPDSIKVIVDWIKRDTTVDCNSYDYLYRNYYAYGRADMGGNFLSAAAAPGAQSAGSGGTGGSMARFTLLNQRLYTVTNSAINVIDVTSPQDPVLTKSTNLGWNIETIYPFKNKLFIGSTGGMYVFDVSSPSSPTLMGQFSHATSCDPVIADDNFAYVTLRNGTSCRGNINRLDVVNIDNLLSPTLVQSYDMTNPRGLSKDKDLLFICDGTGGLKVFNASNPRNVNLIKKIEGIGETYDVIAMDNRALVVTKDGLYQFDYSDPNNIKLISKISINK